MSRYLQLKEEVARLTREMEEARAQERDTLIADMRRQIAEFGITPDRLFDSVPSKPTSRRPASARLPPKYALNGHTWGGRGPVPRWYTDAVAEGHTPESMLIQVGV